jgi:hypothetical protein
MWAVPLLEMVPSATPPHARNAPSSRPKGDGDKRKALPYAQLLSQVHHRGVRALGITTSRPRYWRYATGVGTTARPTRESARELTVIATSIMLRGGYGSVAGLVARRPVPRRAGLQGETARLRRPQVDQRVSCAILGAVVGFGEEQNLALRPLSRTGVSV